MNSTALSESSPNISIEINLSNQCDPRRLALENFIHQVYVQTYAADVKTYLPTLMGLHDESNQYVAALGFRHAQSEPLFLEQYLPKPIEYTIAEQLTLPLDKITRTHIVEVGNLAGGHAGATRWLIVALAAYLQGAGLEWAVFTAVPSLRNSFAKLGLRLYPLGDAQLHMLPEAEQSHWGRYYDAQPVVTAINVPHTFGVLERYLRIERALGILKNVWQASFSAGCQLHNPLPGLQ